MGSRKPFRKEYAWAQREGWTFVYLLEEEAGALVVRRLRVEPSDKQEPPAGGLPTTVLRRFTTRSAIEQAQRQERAFHLGTPVARNAEEAAAIDRARSMYPAIRLLLPNSGTPTGRKGLPELVYARVAAAYVQELRRGSRRPVADIAERKHLSRARVEELVRKARRRGLLTEALPGRPGGRLTPKAQQILDEAKRRRKR